MHAVLAGHDSILKVPRILRLAGRILLGLSLVVIVIDTLPHGYFRLGIFPAPVFYGAAVILFVSLWPVYQDLLEMRRLRQRRFEEREQQLRHDIDVPALDRQADRSRHVT
jgi:hypothetical protein